MEVHFIAIGGSAMHNLAIALHLKGDVVTGSDDEIFEPSKGRLLKYGILPRKIGWDNSRITKDIDAVILGMHAKADNPELKKAQDLDLKIYSYPEYIYDKTKNKRRVVIGGSHGKTSITSMILHVLRDCNIDHDFMVGAQLEDFECMVKLSDTAEIAVLEGDEYLSSPIDRRPKFHLYQPNIGLISGIAWDHINVFPTFENYIEQFEIFARNIDPTGSFIYCNVDKEARKISNIIDRGLKKKGYGVHDHSIKEGVTLLSTPFGDIPLKIFGAHNLQNLNGAKLVCNELGVSDKMFYRSIQTFEGASKRLELVKRAQSSVMYKDFAHSPSKLRATTTAVKDQFVDRRLIACMELHTFSSLNKSFLQLYNGAMSKADIAFVYYNPKTIAHKRLKNITPDEVKDAFATSNVKVMTNSQDMIDQLKEMNWHKQNLLMMSSGNFDGISFEKLANELF